MISLSAQRTRRDQISHMRDMYGMSHTTQVSVSEVDELSYASDDGDDEEEQQLYEWAQTLAVDDIQ